jgi:beta-barrel assembly-enhancing protease
MRRRRRGAAWLVIVTIAASACATHAVMPLGADGQPLPAEADEIALWARAEQEDDALLKKVRPYDDPLLAEYLARVGDRLAGNAAFRPIVLRDPTLNAFAMPNGKVYVHTGLLSRLDNESQLAMILGHEMTHVTHRHALGVPRAAASTKRPIQAVAMSPTAAAIVGFGLRLATVAAIDGYGRDLERDADDGGLQHLVEAGYDAREAPKAFEVLRSGAKERGSLEIFFFGNPRRLTERIETTRKLVATRYAVAVATRTAVRDTEEFQLRMRSVVRENAYDDIRAGRFEVARAQLDRVLAVTPGDPVAHVYYGDLHRLQAQRARDAVQQALEAGLALAAYQQAAALDPTLPEPHRELGFLYYQQKQNTRAAEAFRTYLALKPDAPDAARIKEYLAELDR